MQALVVLHSGCCNTIVIHHTPVAISSTPDSKLQYAYAVPTARRCTVHTRSVELSALAQPSPTSLYCTVVCRRRYWAQSAKCRCKALGSAIRVSMLCNLRVSELCIRRSCNF
ncbi:hypothetical protein FOCG_04619 [Fusarium oxysporum f. sp. radicis-lycopersici 26381]|nr:hypothetical protein FOWG_13449 [Fusarium oxysporum f. sp. lycopersici MN25]EXL57413.1 hypothetical protein FOCG_04619 [Fusarium oxysporum f. sp. radicis-lycopersici 26381]